MESAFFMARTYSGMLLLSMIFISCSTPDVVIPKPIITITSHLPESQHECISGSVSHINSSLYNIVIYAKIDAGWYNLPDRNNPLTTILEDGTWNCNTNLDAAKIVTEFSLYLVPNGYLPPILQGEQIIPLKMNLVAASKKTVVLAYY